MNLEEVKKLAKENELKNPMICFTCKSIQELGIRGSQNYLWRCSIQKQAVAEVSNYTACSYYEVKK